MVAHIPRWDRWYQGPFYFGNVKSVVDWHASNSSGLFPHGLPAFSDKLGLPLQLYTPFWSDEFQTKWAGSAAALLALTWRLAGWHLARCCPARLCGVVSVAGVVGL